MNKPEVVVSTRPCPVCQNPIKELKDFDYVDDDGVCRAVKSEDGTSMCDYAQDNGCFKTYHDECFAKHECPAHPRKNG